MEVLVPFYPISKILLPAQVRQDLIAFQNFSKCYVFARPSYQASFWLVTKREGMQGDFIGESSELRSLKAELGTDALRKIVQFIEQGALGSDLTARQVSDQFSKLALNHRIKIYKLDRNLRSRLENISDNLYATRATHLYSPLLPVIRKKHELASELGGELLKRWRAKATSDREHFQLNYFYREYIELLDSGETLVDTVSDFLKGLVDLGVFVFELTYDAAKVVIKYTGKALAMQAKALTGDIEGLKEDLAAIGVFLDDRIKDVRALMHKLEEGRLLLEFLLSDREIRMLLMDYLSGLYQSVSYRASRNIEFRVVCEIGLEVLLAIATGGIGTAARVAKAGQVVAKAGKVTRIGPFTGKAIDLLSDIARHLKQQQRVTTSKPVKELDVPGYARAKKPTKPPENDVEKPAGSGSDGKANNGTILPKKSVPDNKPNTTAMRVEKVSKPKLSPEKVDWNNSGPSGLQVKDPRDFAVGTRMYESLLEKGLESDLALTITRELLESGISEPKIVKLKPGDQLYKVVPKNGGPPGEHSPYFMTKDMLDELPRETSDAASVLGLPQAPDSFDVYSITVKTDVEVFQSEIAPFSVNGGEHLRSGGGTQTLVTNRGQFTSPSLLGD